MDDIYKNIKEHNLDKKKKNINCVTSSNQIVY